MNDKIKSLILEGLNEPYAKAAISCEEFYFRLANEAWQKFVDFPVSTDELAYCLGLKYDDFKSNEKVAGIREVIFNLVAYCDSRASEKKERNMYPENRTIATAGIRQNAWVSQLLKYRQNPNQVKDSIKHLVEYIQEPETHFPILSEDHRRYISKYILETRYDSQNFEAELMSLFDSVLSSVEMLPINRTHLYSCLLYGPLRPLWKVSTVVGMFCRDTTDWKGKFKEAVDKHGYGVMWKDQVSDWNELMPQFRNLIEEKGSFPFYNVSYNYTDYLWTVVDFATEETYSEIVDSWRDLDPGWFEEKFSDYETDNQKAHVAFLVKKTEKIGSENKYHADNFVTYKKKKASQKNAVAYTKLITPQDRINMEQLEQLTTLLREKRNLILQGAPGTGKTYSTAALALSILEEPDIATKKREELMKIYNQKVAEKRIFFTTFHQSMDYEEFIEGLKPEIVRGEGGKSVGVTYEVKDGIFKQACQSVESGGISTLKCLEKFIESVTGSADENAVIIKTISGKSEIKVWHVKGNQTLMVKSTVSASDNGYAPLNIEKLKLQACDDDVEPNWPAYAKAVIRASIGKYGDKKNQPVVLIIDEINRGNISKIFGELITLLEKDKRAGEENAITVTLPYSGTCFSVPSNLYIIGTMNTTDRSTGAVDYAIRRRFAFVTLKADEKILERDYQDSLPLFKAVQHFIKQHTTETLDMDDLMIGHSYFMTEDLPMAWEYEIRPLLVEYYKDGLLKCQPEGKTIDEFIAKNQD